MKYFENLLYAFISITIHEIAHIITAFILGIKIKSVKLLPLGFYAVIEDNIYYPWKKNLVYLAGPLANALLYLLGKMLCRYMTGTFSADISAYKGNILDFSNTNLFLALFNILPVFPFDGSKILISVLTVKMGFSASIKCIRVVSLSFSTIFIIIGLIQAFLSSFLNLSLIIIGIYIIVLIILKKKEDILMNMKQILYRRSRLLKRGMYPIRSMVFLDSITLGDVLKSLDFDRFHMIYVLDEKFKLTGFYTEQEVVDGIIEYDMKITLGEFVKKQKENL